MLANLPSQKIFKMKPTLVVLAAGMGSRYGGVKQMDGFGPGNQWLLEYSVFDAINAGFGKIVFILREAILDDFRSYFEERLPKDVEREYVLQKLDDLPAGFELPEDRMKPWGTGHAVLVTKNVVHEPFAVINADDFYGPEAFSKLVEFLSTVNPEKNEFGMVGYLLKNTLSENGSVSRGVCEVNEKGFLNQVEECTKILRIATGEIVNEGDGSHKTLQEEDVVSMNCWAFTPNLFKRLEELFTQFLEERIGEEKSEFYIPFAVQDLIESNEATVRVMKSEDAWFGVTYSEDKEVVENELAEMHELGIYPEDLWSE